MSRLIDADKIDFNEVFKGQSDFAKETREAAQSLINAQPTAYNKDRVVAQLEDAAYIDESFENEETKVIQLEDALKIVFGGGI